MKFFHSIIKSGTLILLTGLMFVSCSKKRFFSEADSVLRGMTIGEKIGQLLVIAVPGKELSKEAEGLIRMYRPGGLVLFGYNLSGSETVKHFILDLQNASVKFSGIPLFISIDQEGGRVKRLTHGVTLFPGNMAAGISADPDIIELWGEILGLQLRSIGINMNLAPVLDVNNNPSNPVINTRSFGPDPDIVARCGKSYLKGLQKSNCIAVGKHFPGHGDTDLDSHLALPVQRQSLSRLDNVELVPFRSAIDEGLECVMTAHIAYPTILGDNTPATRSSFFLRSILREKMKFQGLVISDDLEMGAISGEMDPGEAAVQAFNAGADMLLSSSYRGSAGVMFHAIEKAVSEGKISEKRLDESVRRILELKIRYKIMKLDKQVRPCYIQWFPRDDDKDILSKAPSVNTYLSRKGICFVSGSVSWSKVRNRRSALICTETGIINMINKESGIDIYDNFTDLKKGSDKKSYEVVYVYNRGKNLNSVKMEFEWLRKNNIRGVFVSDGNPYVFGELNPVPDLLLSFSSTPESRRQLALCISGKFTPGEKRGDFFGFSEKQ